MSIKILIAVSTILVAALGCLTFVAWAARRRGMSIWIGTYVRESRRRIRDTNQEIHALLCIADHYEPRHGPVDPAQAMARVHAWLHDYPRLLGHFRDVDGKPPRHTFFYPLEEYDPAEMD